MTATSALTGNEHILIVDDEPANLLLLERMLKTNGYQQLRLLDDPRDVINAYREFSPDLILLDLKMPHLSGFEVVEQLQALHDPLLAPIIILTAQGNQENLLQALRIGVRDFLSKPFDLNELLMRVRNLLDAHLAHRFLHDQKLVLEQLVQQRTRELHQSRLQIVQKLGRAAEYRDEETGNHILRMSHISALLARKLGWDEAQCDLLLNASPMHDIGKIGIPDAILLKPGKLDPDEWRIMQTHAEIGAQLLDGDDSDLLCMARDIAWCHHEKWDGTGYPRALAGEEIPQAARIATLADVFDALTSERPYKQAWTVDEALQLIGYNRGKHFDPEIVDVFIQHLDEVMVIKQSYSD